MRYCDSFSKKVSEKFGGMKKTAYLCNRNSKMSRKKAP